MIMAGVIGNNDREGKKSDKETKNHNMVKGSTILIILHAKDLPPKDYNKFSI